MKRSTVSDKVVCFSVACIGLLLIIIPGFTLGYEVNFARDCATAGIALMVIGLPLGIFVVISRKDLEAKVVRLQKLVEDQDRQIDVMRQQDVSMATLFRGTQPTERGRQAHARLHQ